MIHSIDSIRLLEKIAETSAALDLRPELLLQVNLSEEASKSGFSSQELLSDWPRVLQLSQRVRIQGLMTMAAESSDPEESRPVFRSLRLLRDELASRTDSRRAEIILPELSMGMSGDFMPAVEEGATLVRIGSRVFQGID